MVNQMKTDSTPYIITDSNFVKAAAVLSPVFTDGSFHSKTLVLEMSDGALVLLPDKKKVAVIRDGVLKINSHAKADTVQQILEFIYQFYDKHFEYKDREDLMARFGDDNDVVFRDKIAFVTFI